MKNAAVAGIMRSGANRFHLQQRSRRQGLRQHGLERIANLAADLDPPTSAESRFAQTDLKKTRKRISPANRAARLQD
jgi:hypothetical protein